MSLLFLVGCGALAMQLFFDRFLIVVWKKLGGKKIKQNKNFKINTILCFPLFVVFCSQRFTLPKCEWCYGKMLINAKLVIHKDSQSFPRSMIQS